MGWLSGAKKREATKNRSKTIEANIQALCLLFQTTAGLSDKRLQGDLIAHTTKLRFPFLCRYLADQSIANSIAVLGPENQITANDSSWIVRRENLS